MKLQTVAISTIFLAMIYLFKEGFDNFYIGNNQIIHLNGKGQIEMVSPERFIAGTTAYAINVSCRGEKAVGSRTVANRAKKKLNTSRNYNLLFDNCHQFVAGCLTGDFDNNANNFLWILEMTAEDELGSNSWLPWDT